jgi:hypothetical protein
VPATLPPSPACSQVKELVRAVQPDVVCVELCKDRLSLLVDSAEDSITSMLWHCRRVGGWVDEGTGHPIAAMGRPEKEKQHASSPPAGQPEKPETKTRRGGREGLRCDSLSHTCCQNSTAWLNQGLQQQGLVGAMQLCGSPPPCCRSPLRASHQPTPSGPPGTRSRACCAASLASLCPPLTLRQMSTPCSAQVTWGGRWQGRLDTCTGHWNVQQGPILQACQATFTGICRARAN